MSFCDCIQKGVKILELCKQVKRKSIPKSKSCVQQIACQRKSRVLRSIIERLDKSFNFSSVGIFASLRQVGGFFNPQTKQFWFEIQSFVVVVSVREKGYLRDGFSSLASEKAFRSRFYN